jgi:hypothetical protein
MGATGFEPVKAEPADLQSAPFGHLGTRPGFGRFCYGESTNIRASGDRMQGAQIDIQFSGEDAAGFAGLLFGAEVDLEIPGAGGGAVAFDVFEDVGMEGLGLPAGGDIDGVMVFVEVGDAVIDV